MNKSLAIKVIKNLPSNFSIEELAAVLLFADKVNEGLRDVKGGRVYSTEEARCKLSKALKNNND